MTKNAKRQNILPLVIITLFAVCSLFFGIGGISYLNRVGEADANRFSSCFNLQNAQSEDDKNIFAELCKSNAEAVGIINSRSARLEIIISFISSAIFISILLAIISKKQ